MSDAIFLCEIGARKIWYHVCMTQKLLLVFGPYVNWVWLVSLAVGSPCCRKCLFFCVLLFCEQPVYEGILHVNVGEVDIVHFLHGGIV